MNEPTNRILDYATPLKRRPLLWLRITSVVIVSLVAALILFMLWVLCWGTRRASLLPVDGLYHHDGNDYYGGLWPWLECIRFHSRSDVSASWVAGYQYVIHWHWLIATLCVSVGIVLAVIWFGRRMLYNKP